MKYVFCLFVFLSSLSLHAQSWQKTYGTNAPHYYSNSVASSYDKGILIPMQTNASYSSLLLKTDANGNILWQRFTDSFTKIEVTYSLKDGSLLLGGSMGTKIADHSFILKLDACGDTLWSKIILDSNSDASYISKFRVKSNGDILALGNNYGLYNSEPTVLFCFDYNGIFKWQFAEGSFINDLLMNPDNSILLSGGIYTHDSNLAAGVSAIHSIVTLIDSSGKRVWSDIYGHIAPYKYGAYGYGFYTLDKGYMTIHNNYDPNSKKEGNMYAVKFDANGNRQWVKYFGDSASYEAINDGLEVSDSTCFLVGFASNTSTGFEDSLMVMKVDFSGNLIGRKDYNLGSNSYGVSITPTFDGNYLVCSILDKITNYNSSIIKIDANMNLLSIDTSSHYKYDYLCSHKINASDSIHFMHNYTILRADTMHFYTGTETITVLSPLQLKIYPNPFTNSTNISYTLQQTENVKIEVMDIMGRNIATLINSRQEPGNHTVIFNASDYNSANAGIYIVRMTVGACVTNKQIILVK